MTAFHEENYYRTASRVLISITGVPGSRSEACANRLTHTVLKPKVAAPETSQAFEEKKRISSGLQPS